MKSLTIKYWNTLELMKNDVFDEGFRCFRWEIPSYLFESFLALTVEDVGMLIHLLN